MLSHIRKLQFLQQTPNEYGINIFCGIGYDPVPLFCIFVTADICILWRVAHIRHNHPSNRSVLASIPCLKLKQSISIKGVVISSAHYRLLYYLSAAVEQRLIASISNQRSHQFTQNNKIKSKSKKEEQH